MYCLMLQLQRLGGGDVIGATGTADARADVLNASGRSSSSECE